MKNLIFFFTLCFVVTMMSTAVGQQMTTYYVNVKTADKYLGGTDNDIAIKIHGWTQDTGNFWLDGNHERNDTDGFSITKRDVGKIYSITIDVDGQLSDKWYVEYITITKNSKEENKNSTDGYYEFRINKELGYGAKNYKPTYKKDPSIQVKANGELVIDKEIWTKVNFANNPNLTEPQPVMRYKEKWNAVQTVGVSSSKQTKVDLGVTVSYTPPSNTGGYGGEASASWQKLLRETSTESNSKLSGSEFDWTYTAPANTAIFRKIKFEIPYGYQVYKDDTGNSRVIKKLNAQIVPTGFDDFLSLPKKRNGEIIPVKWQEIEKNWLVHMEASSANAVRQKKNEWLRDGWVADGMSNNNNNNNNNSSLTWKKYTGQLSSKAVMGGKENGKSLAICQCEHDNGTHPGKVVANKCNIGYGGQEISKSNFNVLTNPTNRNLQWVKLNGNQIPANAVIGGKENGQPLYVGRVQYKNNNGQDLGLHNGKIIVSGNSAFCNFGYGGQEMSIQNNIYILVQD